MDPAILAKSLEQATGFVCQEPELPFPEFLTRPWEEGVDWHLLHHALARLPRSERLHTLSVLRSQGQWEPLLDSADPTLVALVKDWLSEWPSARTELMQRLGWPLCSTRQRKVDLLLEASTLLDQDGRLTPALLELLREFGAWPDPSARVTVPKHALSLEQLEQVCEALTFMPDRDYLRTVLHMDMQVDPDQVNHGVLHRILCVVAGRARDFLPTGEVATGHSGVGLLEGLADEPREE